ncbi:MAG: glycosyl hydrolase [Microgenomates group bacterium]
MRKFWLKNWKSITIVLGLVFLLPFTIPLAINAWRLMTGASFAAAAIVVDVSAPGAPIRKIWSGVSQGFEKLPDSDFRLSATSGLLKSVGTKYVRIDHIYDGFNVVSKVDGRLQYDWTKLDALIADITAAGAKPYFSLSYMPTAISKGDILDFPTDWGEWGQVVSATVAHYSRDYRGGIEGVIYEVWNEPDLFGGWKMGGSKNYVTLYSVAANAANRVSGTKTFKIGGPATTGFYPAWVTGFYDKLDSTVRIDFFSWHRYSANVDDFVKDVTTAKEMMQTRIARSQDLYISEWGVNPERSSAYDGRWAGAHFLAVNAALADSAIDLILAFEVMDGAPGDKKYHGGWGMLTNPKYGAVEKKPRFKALEMISKLDGAKLPVIGNGTYVTALSTYDDRGVIRVLATNYDSVGSHDEVFPLTIVGLSSGLYSVKEEYLSGRVLNTEVSVGSSLRREISLNESDSVLLTVTKK